MANCCCCCVALGLGILSFEFLISNGVKMCKIWNKETNIEPRCVICVSLDLDERFVSAFCLFLFVCLPFLLSLDVVCHSCECVPSTCIHCVPGDIRTDVNVRHFQVYTRRTQYTAEWEAWIMDVYSHKCKSIRYKCRDIRTNIVHMSLRLAKTASG